MTTKIYCLFFIILSLHTSAQYKNLVFEGGGIRGVAYAGVVTALEQKGLLQHIEKVAGTSAGSIIALMISLGYNAEEIDSMMTKLRIEQFNDGKGGLIGKYTRVKKFYGIHKGDEFEKWLELLIEKKLHNKFATFADLRAMRLLRSDADHRLKDFYCVGTNLTKQQAEIFSFETSPNMPLRTAVRISCSIPLFYEPVLLDSTGTQIKNPAKGQYYQVYIDGGIMANYPVNIFDSCRNGGSPLFCDNIIHNYQTLGIKLDRNAQVEQLAHSTDIPGYNINNLNDYISAFVNLMMETMNRKPNLENEKGRTIYIGYGDIFSKPRKMKSSEKKELFESGKNAVEKFFGH
ncbi:MAG: patatin-like phospholipase family protein [Ferruginibacter sp.]